MDLHGKLTRPGLPHTGVSHGRFPLAGSKHDLHSNCTWACPCRAQV
ncbi:Alanine racemase [Gossypium arboreum]|uniref:Alanine racemase n=1 Tax=Gossypium arboreum TaxID=29729 RepID=A0A0B0N5Z7_GOSAR|nr:Alanine racemase [Gossypium arboreum]